MFDGLLLVKGRCGKLLGVIYAFCENFFVQLRIHPKLFFNDLSKKLGFLCSHSLLVVWLVLGKNHVPLVFSLQQTVSCSIRSKCASLCLQRPCHSKRGGRRPSKSKDKGPATSSGPSKTRASADGLPSFVFPATKYKGKYTSSYRRRNLALERPMDFKSFKDTCIPAVLLSLLLIEFSLHPEVN